MLHQWLAGCKGCFFFNRLMDHDFRPFFIYWNMFYTALSRVTSHIQNLCENQPEGTFKGGFFPPMFFVKKLVPQVTTEEYIYLVDIPVGILVFGIV